MDGREVLCGWSDPCAKARGVCEIAGLAVKMKYNTPVYVLLASFFKIPLPTSLADAWGLGSGSDTRITPTSSYVASS